MSEIKKGDLVKVTITDAVRHIYSDGDFELEHGVILYNATHPDLHTVEKIEPPVEVFKPGDVVRRKDNPELVFALGLNGYMRVGGGSSFYGGGWPHYEYHDNRFTSEHFEKVNLS